MFHRKPVIFAATVLAALGLAVAGCGGDDNGGAAPPAAEPPAAEPPAAPPAEGVTTELDLAADPGGALAFDKTSLEAPAGTIIIHFTNDSDVPHDASVEGEGVDVVGETFQGGGTKDTVLENVAPGTYTFYCSVPGHRGAGMEGTLTVS